MENTEILFKRYYSRLCHFAWQLLDDKSMSEDIVQNVFVAFIDSRPHISEEESAIKNFLYSAVRHACYNNIRHHKVEKRFFENNPMQEVEEQTVLHKIIRAEAMDEIYKALSELPEACQQIFRLGYLEGLSNPKIAKKLNISVNTVKTQKQRGLKVLKEKIKPELFVLILLFLH